MIDTSATFTCVVELFNPASYVTIRWTLQQPITSNATTVYDDVSPEIQNGTYNGFVATSTYAMTSLSRDDNGQVLSCVPLWRGDELENLEETLEIVVYCE